MDLSKVRGKWDEIKAALPGLMVGYEDDIAAAPDRLSLVGKSGPQAQKEQCAWPAYYGMKKAEVNKLAKYLDARVQAVRGGLWKSYTMNNARALGERVVDKYINHEEDYLKIYELSLEVEEIKEKFTAICDAFDRRGFALRDWTAMKIAQLEDEII